MRVEQPPRLAQVAPGGLAAEAGGLEVQVVLQRRADQVLQGGGGTGGAEACADQEEQWEEPFHRVPGKVGRSEGFY